jgi:hypothetical protein
MNSEAFSMTRQPNWRWISGMVALTAVVVGVLFWNLSWQPGILVVVRNADSKAVSKVRVQIGGRELILGDIEPVKTAEGRVVPIADSSVLIDFVDASGQPHFLQMDTYVTGGYHGWVDVEVRNGMLVSAKADFSRY